MITLHSSFLESDNITCFSTLLVGWNIHSQDELHNIKCHTLKTTLTKPCVCGEKTFQLMK